MERGEAGRGCGGRGGLGAMPCQVGSEPVSEQAADVTAGRMAVVAAKTAAPLPSRERGRTVDGIIIFKSCMGCIFSALSSVSRPAEITPVSRRVYRDGTPQQSHPPSKSPIFDHI